MRKYTVGDLKIYLGDSFEIIGEVKDKSFTHTAPILEAGKDALVWVNPTRKDKQQLVEQTQAQIVICDNTIEITEDLKRDKSFLIVEHPKLVFLGIVDAFFVEEPKSGIHPTAVVHPDARVHENVFIGPFTYIGKCEISEGTVIDGHVYLYDNVQIGKGVTIHAGAIVGAEGFNYAKNGKGEYIKFPHIGGVVVEENVEIGANACIARGVLGNTRIGEGTKIGPLVYVGANVEIGKHCHIRMDSMIAGSVTIEDCSVVAPSVALRDVTRVGRNSFLGMGAVVIKDVPPNKVVVGNPARVVRDNT